MKTKQVLSHCLARGVMITEESLTESLRADKKLGFCGTAIVPALIDENTTHAQIMNTLIKEDMKTVVVGFNAGDGPSPMKDDEWESALKNLRGTARLIARLAGADRTPPLMVGPVHTHHGQDLPEDWDQSKFDRWMEALQGLAEDFEILVAPEFLNPTEDKLEYPFMKIKEAVLNHDRLRFHWDTGHAHSRGLDHRNMAGVTDKIAYFEMANVGRSPLAKAKGINFPSYFKNLDSLPEDCLFGNEPFCQAVIEAFGLKELCDTDVDGPETLDQDAQYLKAHFVIA